MMRPYQTVKSAYLLLFMTSLLALSGCGNDGVKEIAPRLVKVIVIGQNPNNLQTQDRLDKKNTNNPAELSFDATGKVIEVLVQQGTTVISGQPLGRLMPSSMSMSESSALTSYRAARAEIQSAEADYKRYTELRQKNFISASEFEKRIAAVELARAKFEQSMEQLGFVTLRAIEPGSVAKISFQMGQQLSAQQVVVHIKLVAQTQSQISQEKLNNSANSVAIKIPSESIHSDGASVFRVKLNEGSKELGVLELVKLTIATVDESKAVVTGGLTNGDIVVAAGWHALTAGQKVRVALITKAP
jgi:multidrug efflux pump subunit AcrA (membrane-fusion protein)